MPILVDYKIVTLVEQIGRGEHRDLPDLPGEWVSVGALQGLVAHGWRRNIQNGFITGLSREVSSGWVSLSFECDDRYIASTPPREPVRRTGASIEGDRDVMNPLGLSEALRDLARLPWREQR